MPQDSKTRRNLGYCFIQFNTVADLIHAYECVGCGEGLSCVVTGKDLAKVRVCKEVPFLLCQNPGRSQCGPGGSGERPERDRERALILFCKMLAHFVTVEGNCHRIAIVC